MRVITGQAAWLTPPTRAIWLPPRLPHEIIMKGEVAARFLYIAPERAESLRAQPQVLEVAPLLRELILHILSLQMLDPLRPDHDRLAGLLIDLLAQARPIDLVLPLPSDRRALAAAERLQGAPGDRSDLSALARMAGASLRTLQRLFPDETGLTLEAWRQKARLISAVAALSGGASVTIAALDCGYDSPSAFITAFKRQFGTTPGRYRSPA
jgi:AraC-like DNA-binding protein